MIKAFIFGNIYVGAMYLFNIIFDTNYVMITSLPEQLYEIYPFLYSLPPIFWLELVGILAIVFSYIPAYIQNSQAKNTSEYLKTI